MQIEGKPVISLIFQAVIVILLMGKRSVVSDVSVWMKNEAITLP